MGDDVAEEFYELLNSISVLERREIEKIIRVYGENISYGGFLDWKLVEGHKISEEVVSASIIKCFLLYYVLKFRASFPDKIDQSEFDLTDDSVLAYFEGNSINLEAALALMVFVSDNTVSNYFLDFIGMERMNSFLSGEKFYSTVFRRRFLDSDARNRGLENTTSVSDIKTLFEGILSGNLLDNKSGKLFDSLMKLQFDRSKLSFYLPESIQSGSKTGVLENVWNDVMYFEDNGKIAFLAFFTENMPVTLSRDLLASFGYDFITSHFDHLI